MREGDGLALIGPTTRGHHYHRCLAVIYGTLYTAGVQMTRIRKILSGLADSEQAIRYMKQVSHEAIECLLGLRHSISLPVSDPHCLYILYSGRRALPSPEKVLPFEECIAPYTAPPMDRVFTQKEAYDFIGPLPRVLPPDAPSLTANKAVLEMERKLGGRDVISENLLQSRMGKFLTKNFPSEDTWRELFGGKYLFAGTPEAYRDFLTLSQTQVRDRWALARIALDTAETLHCGKGGYMSRPPTLGVIDIPERGNKHRVPHIPEYHMVILTDIVGHLLFNFVKYLCPDTFSRRDYVLRDDPGKLYYDGDFQDATAWIPFENSMAVCERALEVIPETFLSREEMRTVCKLVCGPHQFISESEMKEYRESLRDVIIEEPEPVKIAPRVQLHEEVHEVVDYFSGPGKFGAFEADWALIEAEFFGNDQHPLESIALDPGTYPLDDTVYVVGDIVPAHRNVLTGELRPATQKFSWARRSTVPVDQWSKGSRYLGPRPRGTFLVADKDGIHPERPTVYVKPKDHIRALPYMRSLRGETSKRGMYMCYRMSFPILVIINWVCHRGIPRPLFKITGDDNTSAHDDMESIDRLRANHRKFGLKENTSKSFIADQGYLHAEVVIQIQSGVHKVIETVHMKSLFPEKEGNHWMTMPGIVWRATEGSPPTLRERAMRWVYGRFKEEYDHLRKVIDIFAEPRRSPLFPLRLSPPYPGTSRPWNQQVVEKLLSDPTPHRFDREGIQEHIFHEMKDEGETIVLPGGNDIPDREWATPRPYTESQLVAATSSLMVPNQMRTPFPTPEVVRRSAAEVAWDLEQELLTPSPLVAPPVERRIISSLPGLLSGYRWIPESYRRTQLPRHRTLLLPPIRKREISCRDVAEYPGEVFVLLPTARGFQSLRFCPCMTGEGRGHWEVPTNGVPTSRFLDSLLLKWKAEGVEVITRSL